MIKIKEITQDQLDNFVNAEDQTKVFKEIVELDSKVNYNVGDTALKVNNSKKYDVFKDTWKGRDFYYIIIESINDQLAFAYSLYQTYEL